MILRCSSGFEVLSGRWQGWGVWGEVGSTEAAPSDQVPVPGNAGLRPAERWVPEKTFG